MEENTVPAAESGATPAGENDASRDFYESVLSDADTLKGEFPSFDLTAELKSDDFCRMLSGGVPVKTAYLAMHLDELLPTAMRYSREQGARQLADAISGGSYRPQEGASSHAPAVSGQAFGFTKEQRDDIRRRVLRGEKVVL